MKNLNEPLSLFIPDRLPLVVKEFGSGHINKTYKVFYSDREKYILQRLNCDVLSKPKEVMHNISIINKYITEPLVFVEYNGKNYLEYDGAVWRMYEYIEDSVSCDYFESAEQIYEFGRVLGEFHKCLMPIDCSQLCITIEDFHNTPLRIQRVLGIINDKIEFLQAGDKYFERFQKALNFAHEFQQINLPQHAVHNDVKCSNLLLDKQNGRGITLIDFDTVMPGYYAYDLGDGIRSACCVRGRVELSKVRAFCKGYFSHMLEVSGQELVLGTLCITYELAARYLSDALTCENYFRDKSIQEKICRCDDLLKTAESVELCREDIIRLVDTLK